MTLRVIASALQKIKNKGIAGSFQLFSFIFIHLLVVLGMTENLCVISSWKVDTAVTTPTFFVLEPPRDN
jgi:hypothetical protein